ncbi:MAG: hypothetical protein JWL73_412 [Actinomycetia bacterium]|nr:hypothetical protein [Actinomycetes bacterium]
MDQAQYCDAIATAAATIVEVARQDPDAAVPSCPDWDVRQLAFHVGSVHRMATAVVATPVQEAAGMRGLFAAPDPATDPGDWVEAGAATLVATLRAADPGAPVFTFWPPHVMPFWFRRQANETEIHRWDAQLAVGTPDPVPTDLAITGVEEKLEKFAAHPRYAEVAPGSGTVHLHATDAPGEWLVTFSPTGLLVDRSHAKGDVAVRATASDLDLLVSGRLDSAALEVFGDVSLLDRFVALDVI